MSTVSGYAGNDVIDVAGAPADTIQATWRDPKRYAWLFGLFVPVLPFIAWGLAEATGLTVFWYSGLMLVFGLFPLFDYLRGRDDSNPPDYMIKQLEADRYYRWCTYLYLPLQYAVLIVASYLWADGGLSTVASV
ncbi:MAG: hypothetical protein ACYDA6_05345, partial [Solirubrobacteraceae bacterium]